MEALIQSNQASKQVGFGYQTSGIATPTNRAGSYIMGSRNWCINNMKKGLDKS
jgi:hypothetical protein